ncbi:MAG: PIN domain-containing protein, partial [Acidiferrobacterales bacterium]|nr:PIN domain-containing protein [Acidiferrobacterales bacterium]
MSTHKKIFVLDTNVLIHDPTALLRFQEHDIYLPIVVLEELDHAKVGMSEEARNVRQVSRFIDDLVEHVDGDIAAGVQLPSAVAGGRTGRLYFYSNAVKSKLPNGLSSDNPDNALLGITLDLSKGHPESEVTLVSKDINLRIKAHALGIRAEDYTNDQVLDDANLLYTGAAKLDDDFPETLGDRIKAESVKRGAVDYRVRNPRTYGWYPNEFVYTEGPVTLEFMVHMHEDGSGTLDPIQDYTQQEANVWGIHARNREQNFGLNLLMDPEIDFVTLLGQAGTGKTLLTLAAG